MSRQVEAIYENGVLRPLEPLGLKEHERVLVSISHPEVEAGLAIEYMDRIKREVREESEPAPGIDEVQRRLSKIAGSMSDFISAHRGEY
jgi:predicted DNA-binding antitoxin AbrB/MazE fold protein